MYFIVKLTCEGVRLGSRMGVGWNLRNLMPLGSAYFLSPYIVYVSIGCGARSYCVYYVPHSIAVEWGIFLFVKLDLFAFCWRQQNRGGYRVKT